MLGALIGAAASLGSAFLSKKSADKANRATEEANAANIAFQKQANAKNIQLARETNKQQLAIHRQNQALQKDFAKSGISWKVKDALKSGIHPLFALGAQTTSYAPQSVGLDTATVGAPYTNAATHQPDYSGIAEAGQNLGRAIQATNSVEAQMQAMQVSLAQAQVTGAHLDNDIKRTQLASAIATNVGSPPGIPAAKPSVWDQFDGVSGDAIRATTPTVELKTRRDVADPRAPHNVVGSGPSVAYVKTSTGGYEPVMPPELAESYESDWMGSMGWQLRNRILPNVINMPPPKVGQPGEVVRWNTLRQEWEIVKPSNGKRWFPN